MGFKGNYHSEPHSQHGTWHTPMLTGLRKPMCPQFPRDGSKASSVKLFQGLEDWERRVLRLCVGSVGNSIGSPSHTSACPAPAS